MNDSPHEFDALVRRTLAEQARASVPPPGLAARLVANATKRRSAVTPITSAGRSRRAREWTAPLVAAAAVLVVAGATVAVTALAGGGHDPHPAAPATTSTATRATPAPTDFKGADAFFRDAQHGYALGVSGCRHVGGADCAVTLIATDDGGRSWRRLDVPSGLHPMFPTTDTDGSCGSNGDILGVCVDNVVFADARHGFLYSPHAFFATSDGGATWQREQPAPGQAVNVSAVAAGPNYVYRIRATADGSAGLAARLERRPLSGGTWSDVSPGVLGSGNSFTWSIAVARTRTSASPARSVTSSTAPTA